MREEDHFTFHQLSLIEKIIDDETWLEGERRGCRVSPSDPVVRENVCLVILRCGAEVRESAKERLARGLVGDPSRHAFKVRTRAA